MVESFTCRSQFVALWTVTEWVKALHYKLWMFGILFECPMSILGDNERVPLTVHLRWERDWIRTQCDLFSLGTEGCSSQMDLSWLWAYRSSSQIGWSIHKVAEFWDKREVDPIYYAIEMIKHGWDGWFSWVQASLQFWEGCLVGDQDPTYWGWNRLVQEEFAISSETRNPAGTRVSAGQRTTTKEKEHKYKLYSKSTRFARHFRK